MYKHISFLTMYIEVLGTIAGQPKSTSTTIIVRIWIHKYDVKTIISTVNSR